jgi:phosphatidate phosphatase APP1
MQRHRGKIERMPSWERVVGSVAYNVEEHFDRLKFRLRKRLGRINAVIILAYRGHGTADSFYLKGRVIEYRGMTAAKDNDSVWRNLLNMYRRFASDEIPGAKVRARFGDNMRDAVTDREGFFELVLLPDDKLLRPDRFWYDVSLELVEYPGPRQGTTRVTAKVIVPPPDAEFGVISDLDDTVLKSDVVNYIKLARNTFLRNAHTRLPFEGVASFYQALQAGTGVSYNPIYYVSSSPWNLYDLLDDFFEIRGIPAGPLFLTKVGIRQDQLFKPDRRKHKLNHIQTLLRTHPDLPFVLIGDSGEIDPEIYLQVVLDHPGRIKVIYIRDVHRKGRGEMIAPIAEQVRAAGSELVLVTDTVAAAVHAVERGLISADALPAIREERSQDQQPSVIEELLDEEM